MSIVLSANNDDEPWRLVQLARVVVFLGDRFFTMHPAIEALHAHKGCLTVTWNGEPSERDTNFLSRAWHEVGQESRVEHKVKEAQPRPYPVAVK